MMKKLGIGLMALIFLSVSCSSDDDGYRDLPQEDQNSLDDQAIVQYLEDHYFNPERGTIKRFDDETDEDDDFPSLKSLGVKLPSGVWVVKNPNVTAEGPSITDNINDSILISYNSMRFKASDEFTSDGGRLYETYLNPFYNTIYSTGTPAWDPIFYYRHITEEMTDMNIDLESFVIEGFVEGLKEFSATETSGVDLYNFQGVILVPSRLAYGRDFVYLGGNLDANTYRDNSFVFNFELHKVVPRNND